MKIINSLQIADYKKYIDKKYTQVFIIIDKNLKKYYKYFNEFTLIEIQASEKNKSLALIEKIYKFLLLHNADRYSLIIGVGGGVTTDIAGYVAATYHRGIDCSYIPTSLLAQCDASIGGKNGVNFGGFKNIIGTITTPKWIFISPTFLASLPKRILKEGVAEMVKGFIISDSTLYKKCVEFFSKPIDITSQTTLVQIDHFANKCRNYKLEIVKSDPKESGARRWLNLGHTVGHAIEKLTSDDNDSTHRLLHGECVAIGMVVAAQISSKMNFCTNDVAEVIKSSLKSISLPTNLPQQAKKNKDKLIEIIQKDKKREGDYIHFIFIKKIGEVVDKRIRINKLEKLIQEVID